MRSVRIALTAAVVLTVLLGAGVAGAQMDDGMDDGMDSDMDDSTDDGMDNGMDDDMDGDQMGDGMDDDSMDDGMDDDMDGDQMDDDSMDDGMEDGMDDTTTFTVRVENVAPTDFYASDSSTGGQVWVTPGAYAVHTHSNPIFEEGESASVGLEAQAEAGPPTGFEGQPGLVDELGDTEGVVTAGAFTPANTVEDPNDPMGEVPGAPPIAPDGAFEFEVEATQGQHLSFATMFVPSNDLFFSPGSEGIALWDGDEPVSGDVTDEIDLWDAGTETNQEPGFGPDQAPAQSSPDQGDDEGGVVRPLSTVDDGFEYPATSDAIRVTVTPQGEMEDGMDDGMDDDGTDDNSMGDDGMDDGMEDDGMDDDGMEDDMDGGMDDGGTNDDDNMDDGSMEGGNMDDGMDDSDMNDQGETDDSMEDEDDSGTSESQNGGSGGEELPGFGVTVAVVAVLLSAVGAYAMRRKQD